jgi:predicted metalloprotease with PDZ domain
MVHIRHPRVARILSCLLFSALAVGIAFAGPPAGQKIAYIIDVRRPAGHMFDVSITVEGVRTSTLDFSMPAWLPGYSKIQDFAKNVQEFIADDGAGKRLSFSKVDKQTWRVSRGASHVIRASYRVFANNLQNINIAGHIDETHAFFNGAMVFCYVSGLTDQPVTLRILKPEDWSIATGLEKTAEANVFRAASYDVLIDCPTEVGAFASYDFQIEGKAHRIAIYGLKDMDAAFIVPDLSRIVQACSGLFGGLPYRDYTFIYHLIDRDRRSGVEHANSTAIIFSQKDFLDRRNYDDFLNVTAHEYFHLWNIKRIRPRGWGPFDYSREAYTKSHWFTEGMTNYYAGIILVRAGLWTREQFYRDMAAKFAATENATGKDWVSLEDVSWNIWLKSDNPMQATVSYYQKGAVVGMMLDLEIRKRTSGVKSLDDVMRDLDRTFGQGGHAYENDDLLRSINRVSGSDFSDFYTKSIHGTEELQPDDYLSFVGLKLVRVKDSPAADLGIEVQGTPDNLIRVVRVVPGSTGAVAGLDIDDIILALNTDKVQFEDWGELIKRQRIGETVTLTLNRRDRLISRSVRVGQAEKERYFIRETDSASADYAARRLSLFGDAAIKKDHN